MNYTKLINNINRTGNRLHMKSVETKELKYPPDKYRSEYLALQASEYIKVIFNYEKIIYVERLPKCIAFPVEKHLTNREKWIERLWGFISGVALSVIVYVITVYLLP